MMKKLPIARDLCNRCSFTKPCLDYALENDVEGIWGATTYNERKTIRKELNLPKPKSMSAVVDELLKHLYE